MGSVLNHLLRAGSSVQWLCKVLEGLLAQKGLQPDDVVRAVELEKAAAAKVELLGAYRHPYAAIWCFFGIFKNMCLVALGQGSCLWPRARWRGTVFSG